jgi:hypothetical protein
LRSLHASGGQEPGDGRVFVFAVSKGTALSKECQHQRLVEILECPLPCHSCEEKADCYLDYSTRVLVPKTCIKRRVSVTMCHTKMETYILYVTIKFLCLEAKNQESCNHVATN